jgi:putative transposase
MYKLYLSKKSKYLHRQINVGGSIYNHAIALHKRFYRLYKAYPSRATMQKHLAKLTRLPKYAWWKQLGSQAIQKIAERIDRAYQYFFQNTRDRKAGTTTRKVRPPTFRKVAKAKSFTLTQAGWKLLGGNLLRIGTVVYKFAKSRDIEGTVKTVTIKRDTLGELYVYFSCLVDPQPLDRVMTGKSAGFDFGLRVFLTGNDTHTITAPQPFKTSLRHIGTANRQLSTKRPGSNHRAHAKTHLARVHRRVAHVRADFHWQTARTLCQTYDAISLETLNLQGMKALWGRKVSDLGFASFVDTLHHVASKLGTVITHIDRWYPSTKECSNCHHVNHHITLRDRVWTCVSCGVTHDRELNAAINIDREGASSRGVHPVRLAPASVGG